MWQHDIGMFIIIWGNDISFNLSIKRKEIAICKKVVHGKRKGQVWTTIDRNGERFNISRQKQMDLNHFRNKRFDRTGNLSYNWRAVILRARVSERHIGLSDK